MYQMADESLRISRFSFPSVIRDNVNDAIAVDVNDSGMPNVEE